MVFAVALRKRASSRARFLGRGDREGRTYLCCAPTAALLLRPAPGLHYPGCEPCFLPAPVVFCGATVASGGSFSRGRERRRRRQYRIEQSQP